MRFPTLALLLLAALATHGCGSKSIPLSIDPGIPAAQGQLKVGTTENGNTKIELSVEHLAPPDRIASDATVYVVWVRSREGAAQPVNLGGLMVDSKLKGELVTVTPLRNFLLFVTPESSRIVTTPTGKVLINAGIDMD